MIDGLLITPSCDMMKFGCQVGFPCNKDRNLVQISLDSTFFNQRQSPLSAGKEWRS